MLNTARQFSARRTSPGPSGMHVLCVLSLTNTASPSVPHDRISNFSTSTCSADASALARSYLAPHYFPFPPFRVVLETSPGACDLAAPTNRRMRRGASKASFCADFSRGALMMPEPFVVRADAHTMKLISLFSCFCLVVWAAAAGAGDRFFPTPLGMPITDHAQRPRPRHQFDTLSPQSMMMHA